MGEGEAETTRRRQGLLVRREELQQLELFERRESRRVVDRPRWHRSPAASERRHSYSNVSGATSYRYISSAGSFLPAGSIFPGAYFSVRPPYFRENFHRKYFFIRLRC